MPTATQVKFDGGHAEDIRTFSTDECQQNLNFDLYTNPHKLLPIVDSAEELVDTGIMNDIQVTDVLTSTVGSTVYLTAFGYTSNISSAPSAYIRASGMTGTWNHQATGIGTFQQGTGVVYKGFAYCLTNISSTQYKLQKYVSAGTLTDCGAITVTAAVGATYANARPFVHPEDNILYIGIGNVLASWDGSTLTTLSTALPAGFEVTSLTDYGTYLAIAMQPRNGIVKSKVYLWGRDTTLNTLQGTIDFGDGSLNVLENINNVLVGLISPSSFYGYIDTLKNSILVKTYSGGQVQTVKSIPLGISNYSILKLKQDDKLYFAIGYLTTAIWCVYRNKEGNWVVNQERYLEDGVATANIITGLNAVGDYFYISYASDGDNKYHLRATSGNYVKTSKYITAINPGMAIADRGKMKQLTAVRVYYTGKASGTIGVKYAVDTATMISVISETTTAIEDMKQATMLADGTAFQAGREIQFQLESTGGVEIKGYEYDYDILNQ